MQSELARDQFIRAISTAELRIHTQLAYPRDLAEALELALEREIAVEAAMRGSAIDTSPTNRAAGLGDMASPKPEWLEEITEMMAFLCRLPEAQCSDTEGLVPSPMRGRMLGSCGWLLLVFIIGLEE